MNLPTHATTIPLVLTCVAFLITAACDSTAPVSEWVVEVDEADGLPFLIKSARDVPHGKVPGFYVVCSAEPAPAHWNIWVAWDYELVPSHWIDYAARSGPRIPVSITWESDSDTPESRMYWDLFEVGAESHLAGMTPHIEWDGQSEFLEQLKASESVTVSIQHPFRTEAVFDTTGFARSFEPLVDKCK